MSFSELSVEVRPQPSQLYRWLVLIFVSVAMFGNYYIYDSINPLERIFLEQLGFSASMFGRLNSSYSIAAVITLLFADTWSIASESESPYSCSLCCV